MPVSTSCHAPYCLRSTLTGAPVSVGADNSLLPHTACYLSICQVSLFLFVTFLWYLWITQAKYIRYDVSSSRAMDLHESSACREILQSFHVGAATSRCSRRMDRRRLTRSQICKRTCFYHTVLQRLLVSIKICVSGICVYRVPKYPRQCPCVQRV